MAEGGEGGFQGQDEKEKKASSRIFCFFVLEFY